MLNHLRSFILLVALCLWAEGAQAQYALAGQSPPGMEIKNWFNGCGAQIPARTTPVADSDPGFRHFIVATEGGWEGTGKCFGVAFNKVTTDPPTVRIVSFWEDIPGTLTRAGYDAKELPIKFIEGGFQVEPPSYGRCATDNYQLKVTISENGEVVAKGECPVAAGKTATFKLQTRQAPFRPWVPPLNPQTSKIGKEEPKQPPVTTNER